MFDVYEVEAWILFGGWIVFAITATGLAVFWRVSVVLNQSNGRAQEELKWATESAKHLQQQYQYVIAERDRAEANAREAEAGHRECARKLDEYAKKYSNEAFKRAELADLVERIKSESADLQNAYYEKCNELEWLTPKRRKDGKFAPKTGKTGEKKKVKNSRAGG